MNIAKEECMGTKEERGGQFIRTCQWKQKEKRHTNTVTVTETETLK